MKPDISLRDYFASQAMLAVVQETQEMIPASFWDWFKLICRDLFHMTFLEVHYREVTDVYENAAKRAYKYADAMINCKNQ